jgi:hypothetical protein
MAFHLSKAQAQACAGDFVGLQMAERSGQVAPPRISGIDGTDGYVGQYAARHEHLAGIAESAVRDDLACAGTHQP